MSRTFRRSLPPIAAVTLLALIAGCATAPITVPPDEQPGALPGGLMQFARSVEAPAEEGGPVNVEEGTFASAYGCTLAYEYHEPAARDGDATAPDGAEFQPGLVVLAHGFMRDLRAMHGWAAEWSARGIPTVVVSFCNSSWFNGNHERNAHDLVAVAEHLRPGRAPVVYAGFSAGGLSALLAAAADPRAVAYLGLDPVDSGELTASVRSLTMPAFFLFGAPGACNAENNMLGLLPEAQPRLALRVPFASHCSFENPYDPACETICGAVEPEEAARLVTETIHVLATAWIEAQLGISPAARAAFYRQTLDELETDRRIELLSYE